jgi:hypothetical protein
MGQKATSPLGAKLPLLSESGQKPAKLICPLSAKSGQTIVGPKSNDVRSFPMLLKKSATCRRGATIESIKPFF